MPKYFQDKVAGYYLYYTKHCIVEAMHAHASDKRFFSDFFHDPTYEGMNSWYMRIK